MSASWALQKAVYQLVAADAQIKALIGDPARIYDDVPVDTPHPYMVFGATRTEPFVGVEDGERHEIRFHIHSTYGGRFEIKTITDALYEALHDTSFTLEGADLVNCRFVFSDIFRRDRIGAYQGVVRFRAVTQKS